MKFTRTMIGEAISDDLTKEIIARMREHVAEMHGVLGHSILIEEGGRMVILISDWPRREDCLTYHSSRPYRQFVGNTEHMLVGNYVVTIFMNKTA